MDVRQLWQEIGRPEAAQATPEQLLAFMRRCDDEYGLELAARMLRNAEDAHNCWLHDHDALLDELRWTRAELAKARPKADALDAFLAGDAHRAGTTDNDDEGTGR